MAKNPVWRSVPFSGLSVKCLWPNQVRYLSPFVALGPESHSSPQHFTLLSLGSSPLSLLAPENPFLPTSLHRMPGKLECLIWICQFHLAAEHLGVRHCNSFSLMQLPLFGSYARTWFQWAAEQLCLIANNKGVKLRQVLRVSSCPRNWKWVTNRSSRLNSKRKKNRQDPTSQETSCEVKN